MKLSITEKKEMLKDGKSKKRMFDFRKGRNIQKKISFEDYISWLENVQKINPIISKKKFVIYKNVKI